jgi:hypothetical protein
MIQKIVRPAQGKLEFFQWATDAPSGNRLHFCIEASMSIIKKGDIDDEQTRSYLDRRRSFGGSACWRHDGARRR